MKRRNVRQVHAFPKKESSTPKVNSPKLSFHAKQSRCRPAIIMSAVWPSVNLGISTFARAMLQNQSSMVKLDKPVASSRPESPS
jgi:hypothetical protein